MSEPTNSTQTERMLRRLLMIAILALVVFLTLPAAARVLDVFNLAEIDDKAPITDTQADPNDVLLKAQAAADAAENTANTVQVVLSFLEGAAVLVGLALGAAAYFGFRNFSEMRSDMKEIQADFDAEIAKGQALRAQVETYRAQLEQLPLVLQQVQDYILRVEAALDSLSETTDLVQQTVVDLLRANQAFNLNNYQEAYDAALHALERSPNNAQALYIAGWLELQYIPDKLEQGIERLRAIRDLYPDWPTARAAYGIGLRRKARLSSGEEQRNLYYEAEGELLTVLGRNPHLLDLNLESFWGPIGGIRRDMGRVEEAITAYQNALKETPYSSYPMGNLSALYLQQAKTDPAYRDLALDAFEQTRAFAQLELAIAPNDYFHVMDIAMSTMILGQRDPAQFEDAQRTLETAINMGTTAEMLTVSLSGWRHLRDHCPDEWTALLGNLDSAIEVVEQAIRAKRGEQA